MEKFKFSIEGTEVDDLLKVVNGKEKEEEVKKELNFECPRCGENHDAMIPELATIIGVTGMTHTYRRIWCSNCSHEIIVEKID